MANTHKFKVKNGLTTPNISFRDSHLGATITATMNDSTDTLSFEGNAGQLFSITDALTGTLFAVSDISGIPSLEIDDQGIVKVAEFNGELLVGGDGSTKGVTIDDGYIEIRTGTGSPGYIDFYCETNNIHRVRLKSPLHTDYIGNPDVILPKATGTILTDSSTDTVKNKTINLDNNTLSNIEVDNFKTGVIITQSAGIGSNDNETTLPTSAAVKDYVDNNAGSTQNLFDKIAVSGETTVEADGTADTLTLVGAGTISITTNASTDTITFTGSGGGGGTGTGQIYSNHTTNATLAAFTTAVADTSGGAFTLTLPASPSTNDQVIIVDGKGTFAANNLTVGRNGQNIQGSASDLVLDLDNVTVRLNYNGAEWRVFTVLNAGEGDAVTLTGFQTVTNKTLTSPTINTPTITNPTVSTGTFTNPTIDNFTEGTVVIGNTGTSHTFSLTSGTFQTATLNGNCTFTMPTATAGKSFVLKLTQGGTNTATFTNVKFPGGTAPTITTGSNKVDIISFIADGSNWYGNAIQEVE